MSEIHVSSEYEREQLEKALAAKFAQENHNGRISIGEGGASPYSPCTVVYGPRVKRGDRVEVVPVAKSHNGACRYKGRGRWREVYICALNADGTQAVCDAADRGAQEVGVSNFYSRPWELQEEENSTQGLGEGTSDALARALAAVGL